MALQAYSLARDGSTALSPHFCVREFRCKDGSDPVFIDTALQNCWSVSGSTSENR